MLKTLWRLLQLLLYPMSQKKIHQWTLSPLVRMRLIQTTHNLHQMINPQTYILVQQTNPHLKKTHLLLLLKIHLSMSSLLKNLRTLIPMMIIIQQHLFPTLHHTNISENGQMIIHWITSLGILLVQYPYEGNLPLMPCGASSILYYPKSNQKMSRLPCLRTASLMPYKMKFTGSIGLTYGN